ncbi:MAG: hypothetical protein LUD15_08245 [Bacteroides sp.]|nr:hypothetical protein [Bacteroides sp.]
MKQYIQLLSLLLLFCGCRQATSPPAETDSLWVFTNYTIPTGEKGAVIGEISGTGDTGAFRLLRDQTGKFRIVDRNKIALKEETELGENDPYRYEIEIGSGKYSKKLSWSKMTLSGMGSLPTGTPGSITR